MAKRCRHPVHPVVHLELHTADRMAALDFYERLLDWRGERVDVGERSYWAVGLTGEIGGGIVECSARHPLWLPYAEVADVAALTERARKLGASVLLEPRECQTGWRSVVSDPSAGELALWEPREPAPGTEPAYSEAG